MGIVGFATVALVVGAIARAAYEGANPPRPISSLLLGTAGIAIGAAVSTSTGIGQITTPAAVGTWVTALTWACLVLAVHGFVRAGVSPRRALGQL